MNYRLHFQLTYRHIYGNHVKLYMYATILLNLRSYISIRYTVSLCIETVKIMIQDIFKIILQYIASIYAGKSIVSTLDNSSLESKRLVHEIKHPVYIYIYKNM